MNVLIAVHHFPPQYTGGAEWRAFRTAQSLQERGHQVRVVAVEQIDSGPASGVAWTDEIYAGVPVQRLSFDKSVIPDPFRWEYDNPWIGEHFQVLFAGQRPDVFHLIGGYLLTASPLFAARQAGIPSVVTLTDFWFICPRIQMLRSNGEVSTLPINPATCARCLAEEQRRYRLPAQILPGFMDRYWENQPGRAKRVATRLEFLREALNRATTVIAPSRFMHKTMVTAGVSPQRLVFSRQGRDFPDLDAQALEKTPSAVLRLGYLGQIAPVKGVHLLLEAARHHSGRPLEVHVYGDGTKFPDYTARLQTLARQDSRLKLHGVFQSPDLTRVLRSIDVLVVPSLWYENSPNVILEAFAHRTPVIAADFGGMAELVRPGKDGLLFKPGRAADLAVQIGRLLDEPGLAGTLAEGIGPVKGAGQEMDELESIYQAAAASIQLDEKALAE